MPRTDAYEGMIAETIGVPTSDGGIEAYSARPLGPGPFPAVVLLHHRPGWDDWYRYATRHFATMGYVAVSPNLYSRFGHGDHDDVAARAHAEGGPSDSQVVADVEDVLRFLRAQPMVTDRVALFGTCSGGRHAYLAACRIPGIGAVIDCWGGRVVASDAELTPQQPVAPVDLTADLTAPVLGIFGNDDRSPSPADVDALEEALRAHGRTYEFHRFDGAGHGFFYHDRPANYRPEQALEGWELVRDFLRRTLN